VLAFVLVALVLALPPSAAALVVGIGDQQPGMFHDPRFQALGIRYARISIGWNALQSRSQARALGAWLVAARADRVHPLIAFEQSHTAARHKILPTPAQLAGQLHALRSRYPWVTEFATWNEADYCGQPTCHRPGLVAAYYRQLRRACPHCEILGAELLDEPNMVAWVRAFKRALHGEASIWGLHNYIGANRLQSASTRALLGATRGQVWFTETAGLVARRNHSGHGFPESATHAAQVTQFVFTRLARLSSRVRRVYLYQWQAGAKRREPWDSALIAADGVPRPAFGVLVRELKTVGQLPATPAAAALLAAAGGASS
jgi:polysaccharide biosynthesis protein PslG